MTRAELIGFAAILIAHSSPAAADIAVSTRGIVSPFSQATMELEWVAAPERATGVVRWFDPVTPNVFSGVFDLATARAGDMWTAPTLYDHQQPVTLGYAPSPGTAAIFDLGDQEADSLLQVRTDGRGAFAIRSADLQGPTTDDAFFANAIIIVRFAQLPAPGTAGLGVAGLVLAARRRR